MISLFKRKKVTFLDNKWNVVKTDVSVPDVPRAHVLIYLTHKYYRVCNIVTFITDNVKDNITHPVVFMCQIN